MSKDQPVNDEIVHKWVKHLPGPNTTILSLLGRKPGEFSFYTFHGILDTPAEVRGRPSWQAWNV